MFSSLIVDAYPGLASIEGLDPKRILDTFPCKPLMNRSPLMSLDTAPLNLLLSRLVRLAPALALQLFVHAEEKHIPISLTTYNILLSIGLQPGQTSQQIETLLSTVLTKMRYLSSHNRFSVD